MAKGLDCGTSYYITATEKSIKKQRNVLLTVEGDDFKIGKEVYTADYEYNSNALSWGNNDVIIYMTPAYDGVKYIPVEDGDTGDRLKTLKYNSTGDLKKDAKWYISNMKRYLPGIVKDYGY